MSLTEKLRGIFSRTQVAAVSPRPAELFEVTIDLTIEREESPIVLEIRNLPVGTMSLDASNAFDALDPEVQYAAVRAAAPADIQAILAGVNPDHVTLSETDIGDEAVNFAAVDAWDEEYGDTHTDDGQPRD